MCCNRRSPSAGRRLDHHRQRRHRFGRAAGATATTTIGQITIASFANPTGCRRWATTSIRKPPPAAPRRSACRAQGRGTLSSGYLEGSNVNIVTELVDMIECQRAYEINSKMISAVDDMLKNANQTL
jgi:flagellar basal-body rod protein FlgG